MKSFTIYVQGTDYLVTPTPTEAGMMRYTVEIVFQPNQYGDILPTQQLENGELSVKIGEAIQAHFS